MYKKINRYNIVLNDTDQKMLKYAMKKELAYFNNVNEWMKKTLKRNPAIFKSLAPFKSFIGDVIENNLTNNELDNVDSWKAFSDDEKAFIKGLMIDTIMIPKMKRYMVEEFFRHYSHQASFINGTGTTRVPLQMIESHDLMQKRHVQIHKNILIKKGNKIKIPLIKNTIRFPKWLNNTQWSILILHQTPDIIPNTTTPWCVDVVDADKYCLDYIDFKKKTNFDYNKNDYRRSYF